MAGFVNSEAALFASGESIMTARFEALEQAHTRSARSPRRGTEDVLQWTMEERINVFRTRSPLNNP